MGVFDNFRDRAFEVSDSDARIRIAGSLLEFARWNETETLPPGAVIGGFKIIPQGTVVHVTDTAIVQSGSQSTIVFALAEPSSGGPAFGWTSTRNFEGQFRNATLGTISPEPGASRFSATAAWQGGSYKGQITLVRIVDRTLQIERIAEALADPYHHMVDAAARDGIALAINSGFRTYSEQKFLWEGFQAHRPGFNLAARPGFSNHQNGIALDIDTAGGVGSPIYDWLAKNATGFGFVRTVASEAWHWEFRPSEATKAKAAGKALI